MRIVLRRAALIAAIASVLFAWTPFATAIENESFGLTPFPERVSSMDRRSFSIPLETGATFEDAVRIYNRTDEPINLAVYATDAEAALDDTIKVGVREEHAKGVGTWIDLALPNVELAPRDAKTVTFRVKVRSADPSPDLGAIVVENTDRGLSTNAVQRLHILLRTVPPNTPTSSKRVRTFLLRSPWVAFALLGLVVAVALVWVGARRARRPRDLVLEPGALDALDEFEDAPVASRPVIKRLGASASEGIHPPARASVLDRVRASAGGARRRDDRPLLDDVLIAETDLDARPTDAPRDDDVPAPVPTQRPQSGRSQSTRRTPAAPGQPQRKAASAKRQPASATPKRSQPKPTSSKPKPKTAKAGAARSSKAKKAAAKSKPRPVAKKAKAKAAQDEKNFIPLKDL